MKSLEFIKKVDNIFLYCIIFILLVSLYCTRIAKARLEEELLEDRVELVYTDRTDTFINEVPVPVEVIKWNESTITDTLYQPITLSKLDSAEIAQAYNSLYAKFAAQKLYDEVVRDDSTAYIRVKETVQYNNLMNRQVLFTDRTPVVHHYSTKYVYNYSIVGGMEAGTEGVELGIGLVTKNNAFYKISYNPFNKATMGAVYLPLFTFKTK